MKKLIAFFSLLLCVSFSQEMSAQKIYYSILGQNFLEVKVNGIQVLNINTNSSGSSNILNGELDITTYLSHTSSPWDIIEIYASSNNTGVNPINLFVGEYGLPTYSLEDDPNFEYLNEEHSGASYFCTWAIDAADMYIEVQAPNY